MLKRPRKEIVFGPNFSKTSWGLKFSTFLNKTCLRMFTLSYEISFKTSSHPTFRCSFQAQKSTKTNKKAKKFCKWPFEMPLLSKIFLGGLQPYPARENGAFENRNSQFFASKIHERMVQI